MDDLSDISLNFSNKLSSVQLDDLYTSIDDGLMDYTPGDDMSRPLSTLSFASWAFSPIANEDSMDTKQDAEDCSKPVTSSTQPTPVVEHTKTCVPVQFPSQTAHQQYTSPPYCSKPVTSSTQPTPVVEHTKSCVPVQFPSQTAHQQYTSPPCEFVYPNTITYHQSVNIHNYIGKYHLGGPVWKPEYMWDRPVPSHTPFMDRPEVPLPEHTDPLANLNTASLEFTRCSTPEYLIALNSLHQLDSPPRPNHSAAMNFNCTSSFEESMNKSMNNPKHDSGYNSDLNASPVIQIQDGNIKLLRTKQTSTPQHPQILRMANLSEFIKEKEVPTTHPFIQPKFAVSGFNPKPSHGDFGTSNLLMQAGGYLQSTLQKPLSADVKLLNKPEPKFKTMAEYQIAKKAKSESVKNAKALKRKSETEIAMDSKRRRHNEPLNNQALTAMNDWYEEHLENPYPTKAEKEDLAKRGGITLGQVKSWFANKRNRNNNTRPKKQKKEMEGRLLDICHELARDASKPIKDNAYYIQQLSSILDKTKYH